MKHSLSALLASLCLLQTVPAQVQAQAPLPFCDQLVESFDFESGTIPPKQIAQFRGSFGEIENGVLKVISESSRSPFFRFHPEQFEGIIPRDFVIKFSFKAELNPSNSEKTLSKLHSEYVTGGRFSFNHYGAKFGWNAETAMTMVIGHGKAYENQDFFIKRGQWYHVTAGMVGQQAFAYFQDGPSYYLEHPKVRACNYDKANRWELMFGKGEVGYLDNIEIWTADPAKFDAYVSQNLDKFKAQGFAFISAEHPNFQYESPKKLENSGTE